MPITLAGVTPSAVTIGRTGRNWDSHATMALPYKTFNEYIAKRGLPVTQLIRHGSHPEFMPEPDMMHDRLAHVLPLMNSTSVGS